MNVLEFCIFKIFGLMGSRADGAVVEQAKSQHFTYRNAFWKLRSFCLQSFPGHGQGAQWPSESTVAALGLFQDLRKWGCQ